MLSAVVPLRFLSCGLRCENDAGEKGQTDEKTALMDSVVGSGACGPAGEDIDALVKQEVAQQEQSVLQADSSAGLTATQKILSYNYQVQQTGYWCGPASTRIALSVRMASPPTQAQLAGQLGTTTAGTNHIGLVTSVLNADLRTTYYGNKWMPNDPPTTAQRDLLWRDITYDIDRNYALVANIVAPHRIILRATQTTQSITIAVVGYKVDSAGNRWALIADPANFCGDAKPYCSPSISSRR